MTKLPLGKIGVSLYLSELQPELTHLVTEIERMGYTGLFPSGGGLRSLDDIRNLVAAGSHLPVVSGIIPVVTYDAQAALELYSDLETSAPGRFILGIGDAHGAAKPLEVLGSYLDRLDGEVPPERRLLAALGPGMLALARDRTAGAYPFLVTPSYTRDARALLGSRSTLIVGQIVVADPDADRARAGIRDQIRFLAGLPAYAANLRRMGFDDNDIAQGSDRLIDGVVAHGTPEAIAARVDEHRQAGADHVVLSIANAPDPLPTLRELAPLVT